MTYGLTPRLMPQGGVVHWDRMEGPTYSVVRSLPTGDWAYPDEDRSFVDVHQDFLRDFSSLTGQVVVRAWLVELWAEIDEEIDSLLSGENFREFALGSSTVRIVRLDPIASNQVHLEVRGYEMSFSPGELPISDREREREVLTWGEGELGVDVSGFGFAARQGLDGWIFVSDEVLGFYEGRPGFRIDPESGAVTFRGQWSIDYCGRVGRDLIRIEFRKLYEGTPPEEIRKWHQYQRPKPTGDMCDLMKAPNVATRARRLIDAYLRLQDSLVGIALRLDLDSSLYQSLERAQLEYDGYWTTAALERLARHCPVTATREQFIERAKHLYALTAERLSEKGLRAALLKVGVHRDELKDLRSLKLLGRLASAAFIASRDGLQLGEEWIEAIRRWDSEDLECTNIVFLLELNKVRQLDAHPNASGVAEINRFLSTLAIDAASVEPGWGHAVDAMYDRAATAVECIAEHLEQSLANGLH